MRIEVGDKFVKRSFFTAEDDGGRLVDLVHEIIGDRARDLGAAVLETIQLGHDLLKISGRALQIAFVAHQIQLQHCADDVALLAPMVSTYLSDPRPKLMSVSQPLYPTSRLQRPDQEVEAVLIVLLGPKAVIGDEPVPFELAREAGLKVREAPDRFLDRCVPRFEGLEAKCARLDLDSDKPAILLAQQGVFEVLAVYGVVLALRLQQAGAVDGCEGMLVTEPPLHIVTRIVEV